MPPPRRSRCSVAKLLIGGLGCVSIVQIAILVAATARGRLTMRTLEDAAADARRAEVAAANDVAQLTHRWRTVVSRPLPAPPSPSLLPPLPPPPRPVRAGGLLARARELPPSPPSHLHRSLAAPTSLTSASIPPSSMSEPTARALAAELPSNASMEEPTGKAPSDSSSSGGGQRRGEGPPAQSNLTDGMGGETDTRERRGGKDRRDERGGKARKGGKEEKRPSKGGREKNREPKDKWGGRKEGKGEKSNGERDKHGERGKDGKHGKHGKEHVAAAWAAASSAALLRCPGARHPMRPPTAPVAWG